MSKPEKLYVEGKDYFLWPYEEQTQMKHKVVTDYFKIWATKLGQYHTVYFFDCFGGCGAYLDGDTIYYGSPFLAAEVATELKNTLGRKIEVIVTEPEKDNHENLIKVKEELAGKLSVVPHIGQMRFEDYMHLDWTVNTYKNDNLPVLFFLDSFGYSLDFDEI